MTLKPATANPDAKEFLVFIETQTRRLFRRRRPRKIRRRFRKNEKTENRKKNGGI
ncbi:MAG: hypothetical protein AVDCRST_MAG74-1917 [uncultured Pyrinomonadaceae bacterium]|uniref:Uncharacterized protein n=1 Tax=uncultured Pyrinomonadaceae bacterium TaxID=2283094 RepID=A0A6J4P7K5_9BACT|nr:MAG: hypothetical protein AVDCRST_MAG74-1917 [uncultured Pyrinomonadaceae bacterium]